MPWPSDDNIKGTDMLASQIRKPVVECNSLRDTGLGYEPDTSCGFLRCLQHGVPTPLVRWHHHDEYELHLIVATHGQAFVGDYIGHFEPGQLVMTGPRLPHNWVTTGLPPEGVALRDLVIQFPDAPLRQAAAVVADLREALPLLERSRHGIEFFGISALAREAMEQIRRSEGLARFSLFLQLLGELARCTDYRLLSTLPADGLENDTSDKQIGRVIDHIVTHSEAPHCVAELAERAGMSENQFSRQFGRTTGHTLPDFFNRLRIAHACQLLMETDQYVSTICYEVGFNNVANFNRRFLEAKGVTPKEFRRLAMSRLGGDAAPSPRSSHSQPTP